MSKNDLEKFKTFCGIIVDMHTNHNLSVNEISELLKLESKTIEEILTGLGHIKQEAE